MSVTQLELPVLPVEKSTQQQTADLRAEQRPWRDDISAGEIPFTVLLDKRPECFHSTLIPDLLLLAPGVRRHHLAGLNVRAIRDGINLLVTLSELPERDADWLAAQMEGREWRLAKHPCACENSHIAEALDEAIREHHGQVSNPDLPAQMAANADTLLYRRHQRAMKLRVAIGRLPKHQPDTFVDAGPFQDYLACELSALEADEDTFAPVETLATRHGVSERHLRRLMSPETERIGLMVVDRAVTSDGNPGALHQMYPVAEAA